MTLRDRLSLAGTALKAAVGLFDEHSLRETHGLLQGLMPASRGEPPVRGTRDRLAAYRDMPWLRACAEKVANSVASTEWQLFVRRRDGQPMKYRPLQRAAYSERKAIKKQLIDRGELEQIERHILLDDVLDRGNSYLTGHAMRKVTQLHLDLAGEAFWLKERDGLNTVVGVWPIPAHWIMATPTPSEPVYRVSFRGWQQTIPEREMLWMANPDPENPYGRGTGLTGALADDLEIDQYARLMVKQTFFNSARPDFVVFPKGTTAEAGSWSDAEARRAEAAWNQQHQGFWRKAKPMFSTKELGIHEFGSDMQLQASPIRTQERDTIVQVWGMPPEILGIVENSNRATIEGADYLYERYVIQPRREFLRTQMQERLLLEYDDRLVLDYVNTVPEDKAYALQVAQAAAWALTADEWRAMAGLPKMVEGGDVRMVPFSLTPVESLDEMPGQPTDTGAPVTPEPDDDDEDDVPKTSSRPTVVTSGQGVTFTPAPVHFDLPAPQVTFVAPPARKIRKVVERDDRGFIVAVRDEDVDAAD